MKIIAIANQKGGAGKTPTAVHLSFALAKRGKHILFLDADPQGTASLHFLGRKFRELDITLFNAITSTRNIEKVTRIEPYVVLPTLHLLPAHDELEQGEVLLTSKPTYQWQCQLQKLLQFYQEYDYAIIDTPGSRVATFSTLALTASHYAIVPLRTSLDHFEATRDTIALIEDIQARLNPQLAIFALVPNQYVSTTLHDREVLSIIKETYGNLVFEPARQSTKYRDAISMREDIRVLDPVYGQYWDNLAQAIMEERKVRV